MSEVTSHRAHVTVPNIVQVFGPQGDGRFRLCQLALLRESYLGTSNEAAIRKAGDSLREDVEALVVATSDWEDRHPQEREQVLEKLKTAGVALLDAVTSGATGAERENFRQILRQTELIVSSTDFPVPWEWLYLGDATQPCDLNQFLGSSHLVVLPREKRSTVPLESGGSTGDFDCFNQPPASDSLVVHMIENDRLRSAREGLEKAIFETRGTTVNTLVALNTTRRPEGLRQYRSFVSEGYHLIHFNCHARAGDRKADASLEVSQNFCIERPDLACDEHVLPEGSVVVLNCCDGMTAKYDSKHSLAHAFAERGGGVVVAATAPIDDAYATRFAECFYDRYLDGASVFEAMIAARKQVIADTGNPLCLAYSAIGNIHDRMPGAVQAAE
ncbi:MAG: CHAT domain-containing protein [Bacteroidota bacterium]